MKIKIIILILLTSIIAACLISCNPNENNSKATEMAEYETNNIKEPELSLPFQDEEFASNLEEIQTTEDGRIELPDLELS